MYEIYRASGLAVFGCGLLRGVALRWGSEKIYVIRPIEVLPTCKKSGKKNSDILRYRAKAKKRRFGLVRQVGLMRGQMLICVEYLTYSVRTMQSCKTQLSIFTKFTLDKESANFAGFWPL